MAPPFRIGDRVVIRDVADDSVVGRGVIDGDHFDGAEWWYNVKDDNGYRHDGISELFLESEL